MALPIGTILDGKFKVVQILGEGGMGTVYKVEQLGTPPGLSPYYYAVKELLISPNISEEERRSAIERFNKEIELLRGLKHPRISGLVMPFQERGNSYFVMEFVPGRSLEKILEDAQKPLDEEQVIKWMIQVCEALTYIHTRVPPIILRDLKPGNIMITPNNEVQLIDFGIARRFDPNKRTNTENLGTISYASPEHLGSITSPGQRRSAQNPGKLVQTDARSDVYSLGATMYHLLTNYEPDPIQTPSPGSIRAKNPRLRTVRRGNQEVCPVEEVIIRAMQQDPAQRFQSAEEMRVALLQCLPGQAAPSTVQIPAVSPNATIIVPATNGYTSPGVSGSLQVACPKCGFLNRPGAKFCKRDGQPLVQGVTAPPQVRTHSPIRARPVGSSGGIQARPVRPGGSIQARPVGSNSGIQARPVGAPSPIRARPVQPIRARPVTNTSTTTSDPAVALRNGLQLLAHKRYTEAIQQFKKGGSSYEALYNLGRAYRQYGQAVRATDKKLFTENMKRGAEYFEDAVRVRSDALDAYFQLGMCYRDLDLPSHAINAFKKAQALDPKDSAVYYQLGMAAMEQSQYRDAERYFQEGLEIKPDHVLILAALGRLYIETRQFSSAIKVLRQAVQHDPQLWEAWYDLGRAHSRLKEWKYALSALERGRQINPEAVEIYTTMALCHLRLNRKAEAQRMIDEALRRDPQNVEAQRLRKQL